MALASGASSAAPPVACTSAAFAGARARARDHAKRKEFAQAIRILGAVRDACPLLEHETDDGVIDAYARLVGDLARAEFAAGDLGACLSVSKPELVPSPGHLAAALADPETSPLLRELDQIGKRCEKALDQRYAFLATNACFGAACPRLVQPVSGQADAPTTACLRVELSASKSTPATELTASAGPLVDTGYCCGLAEVRAGVRAGARLLRVRSNGAVSSCDGGEAQSVLDAVYRVEAGQRLALVSDFSYAL
jgi:hypothetical protein